MLVTPPPVTRRHRFDTAFSYALTIAQLSDLDGKTRQNVEKVMVCPSHTMRRARATSAHVYVCMCLHAVWPASEGDGTAHLRRQAKTRSAQAIHGEGRGEGIHVAHLYLELRLNLYVLVVPWDGFQKREGNKKESVKGWFLCDYFPNF